MIRALESRVTTKQLTVAMAGGVMMRREAGRYWWTQSQTTKKKDMGIPMCTNAYVQGCSTKCWTLHIGILYVPLPASTAIHSSIFMGLPQIRALYT